MAKRTGYIGANLHQGTGLRLWEALNRESRLFMDHTVFVLPGGRLKYRKADEYLRNSIFRYVTRENFDGVVVWGSTLAGEVSWKDVADWTEKLSHRLPVVSLGIPVDGVPSISYDAYSGVYRMVNHFIRVHGLKRIVFLRGPENHDSAYSRYEAYRDSLRDSGIDFNPLLVSSPHPWGEGAEAMREIAEKNRLLPGRDYDAVIASSDIMAYLAARYLESEGYHIPDDVAFAGFNDSPEAFLSSTELTTVRLPVRQMVEQSFCTIRDMENNPGAVSSSVSLPTVSIYRRSCGCKDSYGSGEMVKDSIGSYDSFSQWVRQQMDEEASSRALLEVTSLIFEKGQKISDGTRRSYEEHCWRYIKHGGTMKFFFSALKLCRRFFPGRELSVDEMEMLHEIMMESVAKVEAVRSDRTRGINTSHNNFANRLLRVHSFMDLGEAMKTYFPEMGIDKAFVFVYTDDGKSRLESGFSQDRLFTGGIPFSSEFLYPQELGYEIQRGLFVVEPLYYDNRAAGYIILKNRDCPASMIENIRTDISSSIQAIDLYSLASAKSRKAEETEKQSAEFYARITEELREPLNHIKQALAERKPFDSDDIVSTIVKTEHLLELTAVEKGGVTIEPGFSPLMDLLQAVRKKGISVVAPSPLPSVVYDRRSMEEIADCLISYYGKGTALLLRLEKDRVVFHFYGETFSTTPQSTPTLQYVEKLLLMQNGRFAFSRDGLDIYLPYPTLSGEEARERTGGRGVLFIGEDEKECVRSIDGGITFMSYDDVIQKINTIDDYSSIAWNAGKMSKQAGIAVNLLRNHRDAKRMPFICFGLTESALSVQAAIEMAIPSDGKGTIYSFGAFPEGLAVLRQFAPVEEVKGLDDLCASAVSPLFVFNSVECDTIEALRKDRRFAKTPVLIIRDRFETDEIEALSSTPNVLIVNTSITEAEGFINRIVSVFGGEELLPPLTSILVKKAICYLNANATYSISRWQIAGSVNISEDYLTRIFRKEIGISPWDYLNRYRIQIASRLLLETGSSISEIASLTGFQDQAYFCRVFRKVKGFPPGNIRTR